MRPLTENERGPLAHKVLDPDAWWEHVQTTLRDPEAALAAKVARWLPEYEAALAAEGENYQTRAQRENQE